MTLVQFDLDTLSQKVRISMSRCGNFVEACKVCLEDQEHRPGVELAVRGGHINKLAAPLAPLWVAVPDDDLLKSALLWEPNITDQIRDSWYDKEEATENGACAIAFLIILEMEKLIVIRRSRKKTGFDYWLAQKGDPLFQEAARLEISGIRKGSKSEIKRRVKEKMIQTTQSASTLLPAVIVVVEFSRPLAYVVIM